MADKNVNFVISATDKTGPAFSSAKSGLGGLSTGISTMTSAVGALAGTAGLSMLAAQFVSVNTEVQKLKASLTTVTGSTQGAADAFSRLQVFATQTPFQLNEVVQAFIKMQALGLNPTEDSLRAFGNTASAMGKDLNQMIEAVADAATFEFTRLKEFGITAKTEGDKVLMTFQGVTTTIGKNSDEIVAYLEKIGNTKFADAMDQQMKTLGGSISNLSDSWFNLMTALGETGAADTASNAINTLTEAMNRLRSAIAPTVDEELKDLELQLRAINEQMDTAAKSGWLSIFWGDLAGQKASIEQQLAAVANTGFVGPPEPTAPTVKTGTSTKKSGASKSTTTTGGTSDYVDMWLVQEQERYDILSRQYEYEIAIEEQIAAEKLAILDQYGQDVAAFDQQMFDDQLAYDQALAQAKQNAWSNTASAFTNFTNAMYTIGGKSSKKLFELNKVAGIAQATIDTYQAANAALKNPPGPPWTYPIVAATIAMGLANVANIASQEFGGGAAAPAGGTGAGTITSPIATVDQPGTETTAPQELTIVLKGMVDDVYVEDTLVPALNRVGSRNVRIEYVV